MIGSPFYETPEDLQKKIDDYFNIVPGDENKTITGLCYFLGFESRQSFYDYEEKENFSYTIKRARLRIESRYEDRLFENSNAGAIFALKNFGWTDKTEVDQKHTIQDERIDASKLSTDELRALAEIQRKSRISTQKP